MNKKQPLFPLHKIVIIGDNNCGKTSLVRQMCVPTFNKPHDCEPTIGVDFFVKTIMSSINDIKKIHIWDTSGDERFRSIINLYLSTCHGVILVYDVTNRTSFDNTSYWLNMVKETHRINNFDIENQPILLVGTKIDKIDERCVTTQEGEDLAKQNNLSFVECSTNTNNKTISTIIPNKLLEIIKDSTQNLIIQREKQINEKNGFWDKVSQWFRDLF